MAIRQILAAVIAGTVVCLASCSQVEENLKPVELESIKPKFVFDRQWAKKVGVGQDARYQRLQPAFADGVIYTIDVEGQLYAVSADNGKVKWRRSFETDIGGGIGLSPQHVLLGSLDGAVIAVDKQNGQTKWRSEVSSEVVSAPQSNGDVVVTVAIDGRVFAFDAVDGALRWSYDHPVPVLTLRSNASPLVVGEQTFIGFDNGQLLSFKSSDGQLLWAARVGQPQGKTELDRLIDVDTAPVASGPYIYSAGYNARLIAVSRGSGRMSWAQDISTYQNMAVKDDKIVLVDEDSHVFAFDTATGDPLWESEQLHRRMVSPPTITAENVIVLADDKGILHGLDLETGDLIARSSLLGDRLYAQAIVDDETFYLYDNQGYLGAYQLKVAKPGTIARTGTPRHSGAIATKPTIRSRQALRP